MKLEGYITALLKDHNCVIVPDFGGFVANYRSAVIDEFSKKIHPPSKSILFNPKLTNNDGLLGNYISQQQEITYPDALSFINNAVADWRKGFENNDRIEIGEIGFLYQENGSIQFEQSREVNLLLQAYGLRSIQFVKFSSEAKAAEKIVEKTESKPAENVQPIVKEEIEVVEVEQQKEPVKVIEIVDETPIKEVEEKASSDGDTEVISLNKTEKIEKVRTKKKDEKVVPIKRNVTKTVMRYAAAVIFVPVLFYSYWIPMETDALETSMIQLNDFNPVHEQVKKNYQHRDAELTIEGNEKSATWEELTENINAQVYNFELSEDFYVPVSLEKADSEYQSSEDVNTTSQNEVISGNYHVIAGCFSIKDNAINLVKDLKSQGFSAAILDKSGGLTRVSAGGFNSRDAAEKGLDKLKGSGNSGWILKK